MYKSGFVAGILAAGLLASGCGGGSGGGSSSGVTGEQSTAVARSSSSTSDVSFLAHLIADASTGTVLTPACPVTSKSGSVTEYDFSPACTSTVTGGNVIAGKIFINSDAHFVAFSGFSVNGHAVTGEIDFETQNSGSTVILTFHQLSIGGVGAFSGTIKDTFTQIGAGQNSTTADVLDSPAAVGGEPMVVTPDAGSIAPCPPATSESYVVTLNHVTIDAELNGNLIPMDGTVGIAFNSEVAGACRANTISLSFNANSPASRSVQATIDGTKVVTVPFSGK